MFFLKIYQEKYLFNNKYLDILENIRKKKSQPLFYIKCSYEHNNFNFRENDDLKINELIMITCDSQQKNEF